MHYNDYALEVLGELSNTLNAIDNNEVKELVDVISASRVIFCDGCGRSGFQINGFTMRLMHLGKVAYRIGECNAPGIRKNDILIIGSGSGETSALINHAKKAKAVGAICVLITIDSNSTIAEMADYVITIPAPSPKVLSEVSFKSIQPMGALFEQSLGLLCDIIIMMIMKKQNISSEAMFKNHANLE